jgi:hypothetical protein
MEIDVKELTKPTQRVALTEDDLWFICESMTCNVPSTDDMTPEERKTYNKLSTAQYRLRQRLAK